MCNEKKNVSAQDAKDALYLMSSLKEAGIRICDQAFDQREFWPFLAQVAPDCEWATESAREQKRIFDKMMSSEARNLSEITNLVHTMQFYYELAFFHKAKDWEEEKQAVQLEQIQVDDLAMMEGHEPVILGESLRDRLEALMRGQLWEQRLAADISQAELPLCRRDEGRKNQAGLWKALRLLMDNKESMYHPLDALHKKELKAKNQAGADALVAMLGFIDELESFEAYAMEERRKSQEASAKEE